MESTLGRYFESLSFEQRSLLKMMLDFVEGQGADVRAEVAGRELVFHRGEGTGRGFIRLLPMATQLRLAFPRGSELFDPSAKLSGPAGLEQSLSVRDEADVDGYVRRMVDSAYALEG